MKLSLCARSARTTGVCVTKVLWRSNCPPGHDRAVLTSNAWTTGEGVVMTEVADTTLTQVLDLVDSGLSELQSRELVSASQVADMLLDLRLLLMELETGEPALAP